MDPLPCGERVVRCLTGQPIDRVPYGVGLGWAPWGETLARWRRESGNPGLDPFAELGFDRSFAIPRLHMGFFPAFEAVVLERDDQFIVARNERGITTRNRLDYSSMPEFLDYPVHTDDDWERLKAQRLNPDAPGRIAEDLAAFGERVRGSGEAVQLGVFPWGVFGTPRDFLGAEELLLAFCDRPALVEDMMNHLTTLWLSVARRVAEAVPIAHWHIWEDMSGRSGSLISPAMIERFMMPCYDRIVKFAREVGIPLVSVDTDGDCAQLVPVMMRHGINAFLPFEVQAGNDVRRYRRDYPTLGIIGGLDKRALARDRAAIDKEMDLAAAMIEQGRYLPSFDHLIPPDVPWANFQYAALRMREICHAARP